MPYRVIKRGDFYLIQYCWKPWFVSERWADYPRSPDNPSPAFFDTEKEAIAFSKVVISGDQDCPFRIVWESD